MSGTPITDEAQYLTGLSCLVREKIAVDQGLNLNHLLSCIIERFYKLHLAIYKYNTLLAGGPKVIAKDDRVEVAGPVHSFSPAGVVGFTAGPVHNFVLKAVKTQKETNLERAKAVNRNEIKILINYLEFVKLRVLSDRHFLNLLLVDAASGEDATPSIQEECAAAAEEIYNLIGAIIGYYETHGGNAFPHVTGIYGANGIVTITY